MVPQSAAGRWIHATRRQRSASTPPHTTNATNARGTTTTTVARNRALLSIGEAAEATEPDELVREARVDRVAPARVRHHEHARAADPLGLGTGAAARPRPEERAIDRGAHER